MASIIRIKRSSTSGDPSTLGTGELAYSALAGTQGNGGDRLYIGFGTETAGNAANHYVIGGKYFTDMLDHVHGTLTASAAIIVDANKKIDELNVDNITINGNTISSTDSNGNILLDPAGSGYVQIVGTNGLVIPVGTTLQQGPAVDGAVRLNSTSGQFEGYANGNWSSLGGVRSVDGLTYISAEATPGTSDDTLRFYSNNVLQMSLDTDSLDVSSTVGTVNINATTASTSSTTGALVVDGGVGIAGNLNVAGSMKVTGGVTYSGALGIDGGDLYSTASTFNLLNQDGSGSVGNDGPVAVNAFLNATAVSIGAGSGTTTVNNALKSTLDFTVGANKLTVAAATGNTSIAGTLGVTGATTLSNNLTVTGTSTLNNSVTINGSETASTEFFSITNGAATPVTKFQVDSASGNTTIAGTLGVSGNTTLTGDLAVNGGDITTSATTATVFNTTATTVNAFQAATAVSIGATTGTLTLRNASTVVSGDLTVSGNDILSSTATAITLSGANVTVQGDLTVNGNDINSSTANAITLSGADVNVKGSLDVDVNLNVDGTAQIDGATTIGASGTRAAFTVYGTAITATASDNSQIGVTASTADAKTLTITASNSVGDANLDINVDDAATLDAATISLDATDSSNFSITTNSASNKTLAIDASNAGLGSAIIAVGSSLTDNVNLTTASTGQITLTSGEVQADVTTLDVNATTVDITTTGASNSITLTGLAAIVNADTITLRGTEGAADTAIVNVAGQLNVDNLRLDGNTISTTDGSNTLYLDPAPSGIQGLVVIEGNLQVNGTTTTINSTQVTIDDPIFVLGGDTAPTADDNLDRGIEFQWHNGTNAKLGFFGYDDSAAEFTFIPDATDTTGVISGTAGNVRFGKAALTDTTASTTTTSGALTVAGGVGVAGQLNVGGATNKFTATTASSSTAAGAVVVAGGVGVGGNIYVGDDVIGAGAATSNLDGFNIDGGTY